MKNLERKNVEISKTLNRGEKQVNGKEKLQIGYKFETV